MKNASYYSTKIIMFQKPKPGSHTDCDSNRLCKKPSAHAPVWICKPTCDLCPDANSTDINHPTIF